MKNPLKGLQEYRQSVWLDYIRRSLLLFTDEKNATALKAALGKES